MSPRSVAIIASAVLLLALANPARADCIADYYAKPSTKRKAPEAATRGMFSDADYNRCIEGVAVPRSLKKENAPINSAMQTRIPQATLNPRPIPPAYSTNIYPLLRRDFNDVWLFDKKKNLSDIEDAEGALFSMSSDRISQNRMWNVNAMGAVVFQVLHDRYPKGNELHFIGISLAPFVQVDRISNSNPNAQKNNVDEVKFGGSAEIGFDLLGAAHYFRFRGSAVDDRISNSSSGSAVLEWIPIFDGYLNSPFEVAGLPVSFMFGPEWKVRNDKIVVDYATGNKGYLVRTGPQVIFKYRIIGESLPESLANLAFLKSLHGQTTYSWLTASEGNGDFYYFNSSLTYNLDPAGHFGLTGSYTKGRLEDTGRLVDLWKAGLTAKW